jgi:hypothetical protein
MGSLGKPVACGYLSEPKHFILGSVDRLPRISWEPLIAAEEDFILSKGVLTKMPGWSSWAEIRTIPVVATIWINNGEGLFGTIASEYVEALHNS